MMSKKIYYGINMLLLLIRAINKNVILIKFMNTDNTITATLEELLDDAEPRAIAVEDFIETYYLPGAILYYGLIYLAPNGLQLSFFSNSLFEKNRDNTEQSEMAVIRAEFYSAVNIESENFILSWDIIVKDIL